MLWYLTQSWYRKECHDSAPNCYARLCRLPEWGLTFSQEPMGNGIGGGVGGRSGGSVNWGWYVKWKKKKEETEKLISMTKYSSFWQKNIRKWILSCINWKNKYLELSIKLNSLGKILALENIKSMQIPASMI